MKEMVENWRKYCNALNESGLHRVWRHMLEHECCIISAFRDDPYDKSKCVEKGGVAGFSPEEYRSIISKLRNTSEELKEERAGVDESLSKIFTENMSRHMILKALLLRMGYGVTTVKGAYIENYKEPKKSKEEEPGEPVKSKEEKEDKTEEPGEPKKSKEEEPEIEVSEESLFCVNLKDDPSFVANMEELGRLFCQDSILIIPRGAEGTYLLGTNNSGYPGLGKKVPKGKLRLGKRSKFMTKISKNRPFRFDDKLESGDETE